MRKIIDKGLELSLIFLMAFLVVDVLWQVLSRYILVSPSSVTDELAGYLLIWVGLLGAAYVSGKNEHLAIDLLLQHMRPSRRKLLRLFIFLIVFLFAVFVLIVGGAWLVYTRFHLGVTSASLEINLGYVYLALPQVLLRSAKTTAIVLLLVATCTGLSWIMSYENIPQTVSAALLSISDNPVVILILINVILLIVGIFMDMTPAVLIFTPIFLPIATGQLGMDPVHFGIMMVLNLCVGLCTPPVGSVLFIGCSVAGTKIDQVIRPLLPMFAAMVIVLFLVAFLPDLSLLIPRLFGL